MGFELSDGKKVALLKIAAANLAIVSVAITIASLLLPNWLHSDSPVGSDPKIVYHNEWGVLLSVRFQNTSLLNNITVDQNGGYGSGVADFPSPFWAATGCLQCSSAAFMFFSLIAIFISHFKKPVVFQAHVFTIGGLLTGVAAVVLFAAGLDGTYTAVGSQPIPGQNKTQEVMVPMVVCVDGKKFNMGGCSIGLGYILAIVGVGCILMAVPALAGASAIEKGEESSKDRSKYRGYA
eukprot:comp23402_c0_seq1/m.38826 comp23402_c0_seq1/g.38826  ORF comp23402_c0_seq1/g.38826 comp23402_c0_seq1/m.38826 type:complete len:236 (-) comp23402_c0_seq1:286-993(-)